MCSDGHCKRVYLTGVNQYRRLAIKEFLTHRSTVLAEAMHYFDHVLPQQNIILRGQHNINDNGSPGLPLLKPVVYCYRFLIQILR
jgi:hypothetical protein